MYTTPTTKRTTPLAGKVRYDDATSIVLLSAQDRSDSGRSIQDRTESGNRKNNWRSVEYLSRLPTETTTK